MENAQHLQMILFISECQDTMTFMQGIKRYKNLIPCEFRQWFCSCVPAVVMDYSGRIAKIMSLYMMQLHPECVKTSCNME